MGKENISMMKHILFAAGWNSSLKEDSELSKLSGLLSSYCDMTTVDIHELGCDVDDYKEEAVRAYMRQKSMYMSKMYRVCIA